MSLATLASSVNGSMVEAYNGDEDEEIIKSELLHNKASRKEAKVISAMYCDHIE